MRHRTKQTPGNALLTTASTRIIGPNALRKALLFNPLVAGLSGVQSVVAVAFTPTTDGNWSVPAGVTKIIDGYCWGSGGKPGAPGAVLGGGGGGGGAFTSMGSLTVTPGEIFSIFVDPASGASGSTITSPAGVIVASSGSGTDGVLDVAGAHGNAAAGVIQNKGGDGGTATALAGTGGGGGAAGGLGVNGTNAAGATGGVAVGTATLGGYGVGGAGPNGSVLNVVGVVGGSPGAGGGGSGKNAAAAAGGADGLVVLFYALQDGLSGISIAPWEPVVLGQGAINFVGGPWEPTLISDADLGTSIGEAWHGISGVGSVVFRYLEITYDDPETIRAF